MIHWPEIEHHIASDGRRLCDGEPALESDISSLNQNGIRQAHGNATLCPDCQDRSGLPDFTLRPYIWGAGRLSCAHHYTVPVRHAFDAIRNCAHCRRHVDDNCRAWSKARDNVQALSDEAQVIARNVRDLQDVTGGPATLYRFADDSVGYFAPDAPDWREADELKGKNLERALRILHDRGVPRGAR